MSKILSVNNSINLTFGSKWKILLKDYQGRGVPFLPIEDPNLIHEVASQHAPLVVKYRNDRDGLFAHKTIGDTLEKQDLDFRGDLQCRIEYVRIGEDAFWLTGKSEASDPVTGSISLLIHTQALKEPNLPFAIVA